MEEIVIDDNVKVSLSFKWSENKGGDKIEIEKEVCVPCGESNYYTEATIELNKADAIKLVEFIQANLHLLK